MPLFDLRSRPGVFPNFLDWDESFFPPCSLNEGPFSLPLCSLDDLSAYLPPCDDELFPVDFSLPIFLFPLLRKPETEPFSESLPVEAFVCCCCGAIIDVPSDNAIPPDSYPSGRLLVFLTLALLQTVGC